MKVYELNSVYFLVDWQQVSHVVITFSADQPVPYICPVGASLLTEEFLAKATLRIDESLFLGCLLFQNTCVYYFYGTEVHTLSFRLPRQLGRVLPKQLFKETEVLAFFKALRAQNCLSTHVHFSALPTLPELTFYAMFCDTDADALRKVGVVTRFSIGHKHEHIYMRRDWISGQKERKASTLYYISCNLGNDRSIFNSTSTNQQLPLITTNYSEHLIEQGDRSTDNFVEQISLVLTGRPQRIRRLYFTTKEQCEALGPALSRYGLTPVADRDHAEIKVEFAVHPLVLGLTTDYQLLLDTLLEQISAFGNAKEKRLNRVLTAAAVDDLAERLLLQLDTGDLGSIYLNKRPKGSSEKHSSSQHKALSYAQKLVSALSFTMCSVPFALYDEASLNPRGRSLYFQSNIPISSAKQIVAQCSHSSLSAPVIQLSETTDSVPLHTIPGITISVGSKRCPDTWYRLYENHPVRLHIPVQDMSVKRSSVVQEGTQESIPQDYLFFSLVCGISWGDSSVFGGTRTPFDFDLVRVDQQDDSQFTISYLVVSGSGVDTGLSLCSAPLITEAALNNDCHVMLMRHALTTIVASLVADSGRSKASNQVHMSNCYAVARYISGESAISTTTAALSALLLNQEQDNTASQLLLVSIYQRAQQFVGGAKAKRKGTSNRAAYIKVLTDPRCNFAFTHGLLSILRAQKHEQKACISLLMVVPNPMILETIRLLALYTPSLLESSNELKIILGITGHDKLYKSSSYFTDTYINLAASIYRLASSTFLSGFIRSENNSLFTVLSPQVRIRDSLHTRLRSATFTGTLSLGEMADKFEQILLDFLQDNSLLVTKSSVGLPCSNCGKTISEELKGDRCARCQLPFCVSCSLLHDQVFYSSYDFKTPVPLCSECADEESLLEPIYKILSSDKAMTESERAHALLTIFDQDLTGKLARSNDIGSAPVQPPDKDYTQTAILSSFCEHLGHKLTMPVSMRLAGADGQLLLQSGCVCTHVPQLEGSNTSSSLIDCYQQTRLLIKPTSLLQAFYLIIPSSPFSEIEKEPRIASDPEGVYSYKEAPSLLAGARIFHYVLDVSLGCSKHSLQITIPASNYYILGFTAPIMLPQEKGPEKISSQLSLPCSTSSMPYTSFNSKPGLSLLECEAKLTPGILANQRLVKCANSTVFLSIAYPHRTIVKLSEIKSDVIVSFKFPTVRVQNSASHQLLVYYIACLSDSPLDRERRKARESLVRQASDGIVTAVQIFLLPLLNIANRQEVTYQLPLSLRSSKSTMRLLFATAEQHTITDIFEGF